MKDRKFEERNTRIIVDSTFKKELFTNLLKNYGRHRLKKELQISSPMLYHYKNNRCISLALFQFYKCLKLAAISQDQAEQYVLGIISSEKQIFRNLEKGRALRHAQLRMFRENIPPANELIFDKRLDVKKWFQEYKNLITVGPHEIHSLLESNGKLIIYHSNYVKGKKEEFETPLPRWIELDDDFCYFFGLWCGDKTGGGRIGVVNKEKVLNQFTVKYLVRLHQKVTTVILKSSNVKELPPLQIPFDSVQEVKNMHGTYVPMVFAVNSILKQFFMHLERDLDLFLSLIPNKEAFFAGLFDAEGNVFLEDRCFRWSCLNQQQVKIYTKHLTRMDLFRRYDGCNLICTNQQSFVALILPYLKHPQKINDTKLTCFGEGNLNARFLGILKTVNEVNGSFLKNLAKALKKVKLYAQIRVLERLGYVRTKGYPKMVFITEKGLASLSQGGKDK